jgi:hypothetical protein
LVKIGPSWTLVEIYKISTKNQTFEKVEKKSAKMAKVRILFFTFSGQLGPEEGKIDVLNTKHRSTRAQLSIIADTYLDSVWHDISNKDLENKMIHRPFVEGTNAH